MDGSRASASAPSGDPDLDPEVATVVSERLALPERLALERVAGNLLTRRNLVRVGRYEVVEDLGRGGCGVVFLARDPALDREVAIKLVLPTILQGRDRARWQARLLVEARTLARLVHPNVVQVFDVGRDGDGVYLVLERLQGRTLRQWQQQERPSWTDALEAYLQAGRGLHAAHEAGVVHRDFKPDNAMIEMTGARGVVKVIDFGLARERQAAGITDTDPGGTVYGSGSFGETMTRTGTVVGSPAYMAPEQYDGDVEGPASDQFAFCVALFEALYGRRPFKGGSLSQLQRNKLAGHVVIASSRGIPSKVGAVIRRGLSADPEARWPSMRRLVRELERVSRDRPRRRAAVALGVAGVGIAAVVGLGSPLSDRCEQLEQQRAATWNEQRDSELSLAMQGSSVPTAEQTWQRARTNIDDWMLRWDASRAEVCEGSGPPVGQALPCLERSLAEGQALLTVLGQADARVIEQAVSMVEGLIDPRVCESAESASAALDGIDADHWSRLSHVELLVETARYDEAAAGAATLVSDARRQGDLDVELRATLVLAEVHARLHELAQAHRLALTVLDQATRNGLDTVAGQACIDAADVAMQMGDLDQAERLIHQAQALVERAGSPPSLQREWLAQSAHVSRIAGEPERAQELLTRALELTEQRAQPVSRARLLGNLAIAEFEQDKVAAARVHVEEALALYRDALGPHPRVAQALCDLGKYQGMAGHMQAGLHRLDECIEMSTGLPGAQKTVLDGKQTKSAILIAMDRPEESIALQQEALDGLKELHGEDHPDVGFAAFRLARLYMQQERDPQLIVDLVRPAAASIERAYGPDSPWLGSCDNLLGHALRLSQDWDAATRHYHRALKRLDPSDALHRALILDTLLGLAELEHDRGDLDAAVGWLQEGMARLDALDAPPPLLRMGFVMSMARYEHERGRSAEASRAAHQALLALSRSGTTSSGPSDMLDIVVQAAAAG